MLVPFEMHARTSCPSTDTIEQMELKKLAVKNFRSYRDRVFEFSENTTLVIGPNTAGKTNLLEAIHLLGTGSTWRPGVDQDMIRWGADVGWVHGLIEPDEVKLSIRVTRGEVNGKKVATKRYFINNAGKRRSDFLAEFSVVLFSPEDMLLVTDSPGTRRRYLNQVLETADLHYREHKREYDKVLRSRNALLDRIAEGKASEKRLSYWDEMLVGAGAYLTQARGEYLGFLNSRQHEMNSSTYFEYLPKRVTIEKLQNYRKKELGYGATLIGPHRDDFMFYIDYGNGTKRDLSISGSRGQQRTAVFWLKLGELAFVTDKRQQRPVLLLDDLFSELDHDRRERLFGVIPHHQTILTTTDIHLIEKSFLDKVRLIDLNGTIQ